MALIQLRRNDVLASNLLFGVLAVTWLEHLGNVGLQLWVRYTLPGPWPEPWLVGPFFGLLLYSGLSGGIYYNIRHGYLWAKLVLLLVYLGYVYFSSSLQDYLIAGIPVASFYAGKLPIVIKNVLMLGAIGLMFRKKALRPDVGQAEAG